MFDQARGPARVTDGEYGHPLAIRWATKIAQADGFVMTAAEYNHGYTAALKNALDWIYREWCRKPVGFVGYLAAMKETAPADRAHFAMAEQAAVALRDDLVWWARAPREARPKG